MDLYTGFRGQSQGFPCLFFWCLAYCDRSGFVHIKRAWRHTYGESQGRQSFNPLTIPEVMIWFAEAHTEQRRRRQGSSWRCFPTPPPYRRSAGSTTLPHPYTGEGRVHCRRYSRNGTWQVHGGTVAYEGNRRTEGHNW